MEKSVVVVAANSTKAQGKRGGADIVVSPVPARGRMRGGIVTM